MILCTCSFAPFKILAPLPGIDFCLFLPISIQSNLGSNLELYFMHLQFCIVQELSQVRAQLERTSSAKLNKMLSIQKFASDRTGLEYGLSSFFFFFFLPLSWCLAFLNSLYLLILLKPKPKLKCLKLLSQINWSLSLAFFFVVGFCAYGVANLPW